jgi:peptidyl-prolyl cis-trans isomerase D
MITKLQTSFKDRGLKIILWLVIISMAAGYAPLILKRSWLGTSHAVMTINGYGIDHSAFQRRVTQERERISMIRNQLGAQAEGLLNAMGYSDPNKMALRSLVNDTLINQVAYQAGIKVSPLYISAKLQDPHFVVRDLLDVVPAGALTSEGFINMAALQHYLRGQRQTFQEFEQAVEEKIQRTLVLDIVETTVAILPCEVKDAYSSRSQPRSYQILKLSLDTYLTNLNKQEVPQEKLATFYQEQNNQSRRYWEPEKRAATVIAFDPKTYGILSTQQEVEQFYQHHKATFVEEPTKIQVRHIFIKVPDNANADEVKKLEEIAQKIHQEVKEKPDTFADVAKKQSQDTKSKAQGGLLDFFAKGTHDPEFERAAFRLSQDGDISGVIPTDKGFEIIQRVARKPIVYKSIDAVADQIKERLQRQKFQAAFSTDMSRIINAEKADERIQEFARSKKAHQEDTGLIIKDDSARAKKMFSLRQGQWGFFVQGDKGYVVKITQIQKSSQPPLDDVRQKVIKDYLAKEAERALSRDLAAAKVMAQHESLEKVKEKFGGTIIKTGMVTPNSPLKDAELPAKAIFALDKQGQIGTARDALHGFVIKVDEVGAFDEKDFQERRNEILSDLYNERKALYLQGFIASLYRNATISSVQTTEA